MDTTSPRRFGCPCLSDFPQIGADRYGIYISSNQYNTGFLRFVSVSILAISKGDLAVDSITPTTYEAVLSSSRGYEFTVRPAITPPGANYFLASGGVEFFLSSNFFSSSDSSVAVWAMTNTASLATSLPNLTLVEMVVPAIPYIYPDVVRQRPGPLCTGRPSCPVGSLPLSMAA